MAEFHNAHTCVLIVTNVWARGIDVQQLCFCGVSLEDKDNKGGKDFPFHGLGLPIQQIETLLKFVNHNRLMTKSHYISCG
ncbi:hypothetical protein RND81_08G074100 [Saponaria officinalis]|uniref:Helicase C-terminal domain-containing protein n=1 Tax=Saponaria officinalis TaxID=3572 RepID=A0AAW1J3R2_SAPOF